MKYLNLKSVVTRVVLIITIVIFYCDTYKSFGQTKTGDTTLITSSWIKNHLRKTGPKIILTSKLLKDIKVAVKNDEAIKAYYQYLYKNAVAVICLPLLERKMEGRRLLFVSREAANRIGTLSIVYAISNEKRFLDRVNSEIITVCNFTDWNPSHFLDVAEMAYGVSIGLDWTLGKLPESTKLLAREALINKALNPSLSIEYSAFVTVANNWNQVCHGGMSIAAIAIADENPELAASIISRAVKNIPRTLVNYGPDGVYPEGPSYWAYGTSFSLLTISAFESAFDTDFGMSATPGFIQSALFIKKLVSPLGLYFNFYDSSLGGNNSIENQELLSWFANNAGNSAYFEKENFLNVIKTADTSGKKISHLNGAALTWILKSNQPAYKPFPVNYFGRGKNPVIVFDSSPQSKSGFFLAAKGGAANFSHGDMDAGSFVFELNGVRWSVDLGTSNYNYLENIIGAKELWNNTQTSKRWTLLSKSNFGHSTLTVNNLLHNVNGVAKLIDFNESENKSQAEFDLSDVFSGQIKSAKRKFTKLSEQQLLVEDVLTLSEQTKTVTWAMMTQADAEIISGGVLLKQNGKTLKVMIQQPSEVEIKIEQRDPPPLSYDVKLKNLKRIEFKVSANTLKANGSKIAVKLSGE
jgi:hypothetical protein